MLRRWLWLLAVPLSAQAQTKMVAIVAAARDSSPIADAEVMLMDSHRGTTTNWMGEARIDGVSSGTHRVRIRKLGFAAIDVQLMFTGDSMAPVFLLSANALSLDTVRVMAPSVRENLREFDDRRRLGIGHFLTQSELAHDANREFALVAASRFAGVQAKTDVGGKWHLVSTRSSCGAGSSFTDLPAPKSAGGGGATRSRGGQDTQEEQKATMSSSCGGNSCPIKLFLDGLELQPDDFDVVHTWDLAGVEYYSGAQMPPQYRVHGSACGVLLMWSR